MIGKTNIKKNFLILLVQRNNKKQGKLKNEVHCYSHITSEILVIELMNSSVLFLTVYIAKPTFYDIVLPNCSDFSFISFIALEENVCI